MVFILSEVGLPKDYTRPTSSGKQFYRNKFTLTVAVQEIDRELVDFEIEKVRDLIGEYINWYDAILNSIVEITVLRDIHKD